MTFRLPAIAAAMLCAAASAIASPPTLIHRIELPQGAEFCDFGIFSPAPAPTGIERLVVGPPAGVNITRTRLVITFVTSDACQPDFDAGVIQLVLRNADGLAWNVIGSLDLQWSGQGMFSATIETSNLNGFNSGRLWEDSYYATIETRIPGHFHEDVSVVDSYWEIEYEDPNILFGDANCDGFITFDDLDAFVLGLLDPLAYTEENPFCTLSLLDVNGDGTPDGRDIQDFILVLLNAPPVGACCLPGGDCRTMSETDCTTAGVDGVYQGDLSSCQATACPMSQPQINQATIPSLIDNCNGTHIAFDIFGSGFNENGVLEFVMSGEDPVLVRGAGAPDHTYFRVLDFETECLTASGFWDMRITNPDGGTVTLANAIEIIACAQPPHAVDSITYAPSPVETCPGTTPANPTLDLEIHIFGTNLPNEFFFRPPFSLTRVDFESVDDGEIWFTTFVTDLAQLSPTEFSLTLPIYQGNVFFPHSNPPPGEYRIVVNTCSQRLTTENTVTIQPADPAMCLGR